ncbi:MAG: HEAT repeat domain-containing protein, partial [Acidobacteria bacterium]|nr:HEAT repeat domain-containing protein [Acidobacteriota bacterium]
MTRVRSYLNLERGEELPVLLLFLYLTTALAAFVIAKAVRDSLFLEQFSAKSLPYAYIGVALVIGLVVSIYVRLASRIRQTTLISVTLVFLILNVLLLWWGVRAQWAPIAGIFYIWTNIFGIIITVQVWTVASSTLDTRQARRLFPLIGSGGILGATVGGMIAAGAVDTLGTDNLVLLLALLLIVSIAIVQTLSRRNRGADFVRPRPAGGLATRQMSIGTVFRATFQSRYLRLIAILLMLSAIVTLIIDFQFKAIAQESFASKDELTGFFGSFYSYVGISAFLLQLLAGPRIFEKYGLRLTLLVLPLALLAGTAILLAYPLRLWTGVLLKGSEGTIRYSIDRSTIETLYVPVPETVKAQVKAVIDMVFQRVSDGVGGVLLLLMTDVLDFGMSSLAVFNGLLLSAWVWAALKTRKEYVSAVRATLSERQILPESVVRSAFRDRGSIDALRAMLNEKDEEVVLYAMEVALAIGRKDLLPTALVKHPSRIVRLKAIEIVPLQEQELLDRLRADPDVGVRAKVMARACLVGRPDSPLSLIYEQLAVPDVRLRLAALSCLAQQFGGDGTERLRRYLNGVVEDLEENSPKWKDVAQGLGEIHHVATLDLHIRLLHHPNREVRREAILSAGRAGHRDLVPFLVRLLEERAHSGAAQRALQEYGTRILGTLGDVLKDPLEPLNVRRAIPAVLGNIPHQDSVNLLLEALGDDDGLVRFRAIRALNRLRRNDQGFQFDRAKISLRLREDAEKTRGYRQAIYRLYPDGHAEDLLAQLLQDKVTQGKERVFRMLGLILPAASAHAAYRAMLGEDRLKKASATEYLDQTLPDEIKKSVLPLTQEKPRASNLDVNETLEGFLKSTEAVLRECAADAIARKRWPGIGAPPLPRPSGKEQSMDDQTPFQPLITEAARPAARLTAFQKAEILRGVEPFSAATVEELLRLAAIAKEVHFAPGEVILREGEYADAIYLIVEGQI